MWEGGTRTLQELRWGNRGGKQTYKREHRNSWRARRCGQADVSDFLLWRQRATSWPVPIRYPWLCDARSMCVVWTSCSAMISNGWYLTEEGRDKCKRYKVHTTPKENWGWWPVRGGGGRAARTGGVLILLHPISLFVSLLFLASTLFRNVVHINFWKSKASQTLIKFVEKKIYV